MRMSHEGGMRVLIFILKTSCEYIRHWMPTMYN